VRVRQDLAIAEAQLRDYRERLGKPFPHDKYLSELTDLRDQLKAGLSAGAHESGNDKGPKVSELADRIKALKAANTIEAAPQRVQRKQAAAEEPITARIRRRQEANTEAGEAIPPGETPGVEGANDDRHADNDSQPRKPLTFQERIALERQSQDQGPTLL
jgi:exonuclease VII large subunit